MASASASAANIDLRPRQADGWGPGMAMAIAVHLLLVGALALGVRWKIQNPEPVEAEMWAAVPRSVAPPEPPPAPKAVETPPLPVEKAPEPPAQREADIGVTAPKPRLEKPRREAREVFETAPPKVSKKTPAPKPPEPKPKPKPEPKPEPKKTPPKPADSKAAAKAGASEQPSPSAAEREAQRKANLARMMSDLGSLGTSSGSTGASARSAGPSNAYGARIKARIKPNIVFTDEVAGNPEAVVEVRCGPDGRIIARKLISSSGVPSWDEAVLRAVDRTEVLPADESGRVPPVIQIAFRPKDL